MSTIIQNNCTINSGSSGITSAASAATTPTTTGLPGLNTIFSQNSPDLIYAGAGVNSLDIAAKSLKGSDSNNDGKVTSADNIWKAMANPNGVTSPQPPHQSNNQQHHRKGGCHKKHNGGCHKNNNNNINTPCGSSSTSTPYAGSSTSNPYGTSTPYTGSSTSNPYGTSTPYTGSSTSNPYGTSTPYTGSSTSNPYGTSTPYTGSSTSNPYGTSTPYTGSSTSNPYGTSTPYAGSSTSNPYGTSAPYAGSSISNPSGTTSANNNTYEKSLLNNSGQADPQKIFNIFDLNNDGEVAANEKLAYMKMQDSMSSIFSGTGANFRGTANDGILTDAERDAGLKYALSNPAAAKAIMNSFVTSA